MFVILTIATCPWSDKGCNDLGHNITTHLLILLCVFNSLLHIDTHDKLQEYFSDTPSEC